MSIFNHNRKARQQLYKQTRSVVASTSKHAQRILHDLGLRGEEGGRRVTAQSASKAAIEMVYGIITSYVWPSPPKLSYSGMSRTDNRMATKELDHGVITITANVRTPIGVTLGIDVPVEIRRGLLLEPSVMFHSGIPYVISQSSIDRLISDNSAWGQLPTRKMYSGPHDARDEMMSAPMRVERRTPSMFSTRAAAAALRTFLRSRGARGSLRVGQADDTVFQSGQTLWKGQDPWTVVKVTRSPVGGQPMYQVQGPLGELKIYREDKAIDMFSLEKGQGPYAEQNKGLKPPEHHKRLIPEDQLRDKECPECKTPNESTAQTCFHCGAKFQRGNPIVRSDENPQRKKYLDDMAKRIKDQPWLKSHMPPEVQRLVVPESEDQQIKREGPEVPSDYVNPMRPPKPPTDLPGMQHNQVRPFQPTTHVPKPVRPREPAPLDDGVVSVPETVTPSDEATMPTRRQVFRPNQPLYHKPRIHEQVKSRQPGAGQPKPQAQLAWRNENGTLAAQGVDGVYEIQSGVQKGHQQGYALYYKGKEMGVYGDPSVATEMAQKHNRKQMSEQGEPQVLPDQLPWSQTKDGVLIAPGVGRGVYMVRESTPGKFTLYFKHRGQGSMQELGSHAQPAKAVAVAQKHYQQELQQQGAADQDHGDAIDENWRRDLENQRNGGRVAQAQLNWDEIEPNTEWMAVAPGGIRYTVTAEDNYFSLYLNHRRWSTPGPVILHANTLDEAMDAAERDFGEHVAELADRGSLRESERPISTDI